jgi:hypothetical protein
VSLGICGRETAAGEIEFDLELRSVEQKTETDPGQAAEVQKDSLSGFQGFATRIFDEKLGVRNKGLVRRKQQELTKVNQPLEVST